MSARATIAARQADRLVRQKLDEAGARAAGRGPDLGLICDRADDRDPEAALLELLVLGPGAWLEARSLVADLDGEPVGLQLVEDLDLALAPVDVRMPDRVRARLGQRKLEVVEGFVGDGTNPGDRRQGESA